MNALSSLVLNISRDETLTSSHEGLFSHLIGIFVRKCFLHTHPFFFFLLHHVILLFCAHCFNFYEIWEMYHLSISYFSWIIHNPCCSSNARDKQPVAEQLILHWDGMSCTSRHISWRVLAVMSFLHYGVKSVKWNWRNTSSQARMWQYYWNFTRCWGKQPTSLDRAFLSKSGWF